MSSESRGVRAARRAGVLASVLSILAVLAAPAIAPAQTQDLLGVYFDPDGTTSALTTTAPYQVVTAYLLLLNASEPSGVAGWECEADVVGPGLTAGTWTLSGAALNLLAPPQFNVGIGTGAAALPWSPAILLATHTAVVSAPGAEVEYYLHASDPSSLEDPPFSGNHVPCYTDGAAATVLRMLHLPGTCEWEPVATVNGDPAACATVPTISPAAIDFGTHLPAEDVAEFIRYDNRTGATVAGTLRVTNPSFQIGAGANWGTELPLRLPPDRSLQIQLRYHTDHLGVFTTNVELAYCGSVVAAVPCTIRVASPYVTENPDYLFFGRLRVGQSSVKTFTLTNSGTLPYGGTMRVSDGPWPAPEFTIVGFGSSCGVYLEPGQSAAFSVRFAPTEFRHEYRASIYGAADVQLAGESMSDTDMSPTVLDFGEVAVGSSASRTFTIINDYVDGSVSPPPHFTGSITRQAGPFSLVEGSGDLYWFDIPTSQTFTVEFRPQAGGAFTDSLLVPTAGHDLVCRGVGVADPPVCTFTPEGLGFGAVARGSTSSRTLTVRNQGVGPLTGTVGALPAPFEVAEGAGAYALDPGAARDVVVTFSPTANGYHEASLDLGSSFCSAVPVTGDGVDPQPQQDVIGIWFDEAGTVNEYWTLTNEYTEMVVGYILLKNPSATSGIRGWKGCVVSSNPYDFVESQWIPAGQAYNGATPPCFNVNISGDPLASAPVVQLVRFTFWHVTAAAPTLLYLSPAPDSYEDALLYRSAANPGQTIPLTVSSGSSDQPVAIVRSGSPVGILAQAPAVARSADGVALSWRAGETTADAVHVFRRAGAEPPLRLTPLPLPVTSGRVDFVDPACGIAAGTLLRYGLTLLRGGQEIGRSPEAAITFDAIVPEATLLHPAFPNPFNPETTIGFDLARASHARLEVFDCSGRRVRLLADEDLPAGAYTRTWNGRDHAGRPVPTGAYYCRLTAGGAASLQKMLLIR